MNKPETRIGFIGAGGIAKIHALAINSLPYYYDNTPQVSNEAICSSTEKSRNAFSKKYGFLKSLNFDEFISAEMINTVYILSPNNAHVTQLRAVLEMPSVKKIYIEKPFGSTEEEDERILETANERKDVKIQTGFQFLFMSAVMEASALWRSGIFGKPIHFDVRYYHGDYLHRQYREKRKTRLVASPEGGAMADLGSHAISLLIAFLGNNIKIANAIQAGKFDDVEEGSDLFSLITLLDQNTNAAGTLSASRISSGTGDTLSLEIYAEKGSLKFSSQTPDYFEYFLEESGTWTRVPAGSKFPATSFPSGHVPPGWIRSLIHANYVFLTGDHNCFVPDLQHGIQVQSLIRQSAEYMADYRKGRG